MFRLMYKVCILLLRVLRDEEIEAYTTLIAKGKNNNNNANQKTMKIVHMKRQEHPGTPDPKHKDDPTMTSKTQLKSKSLNTQKNQ